MGVACVSVGYCCRTTIPLLSGLRGREPQAAGSYRKGHRYREGRTCGHVCQQSPTKWGRYLAGETKGLEFNRWHRDIQEKHLVTCGMWRATVRPQQHAQAHVPL